MQVKSIFYKINVDIHVRIYKAKDLRTLGHNTRSPVDGRSQTRAVRDCSRCVILYKQLALYCAYNYDQQIRNTYKSSCGFATKV